MTDDIVARLRWYAGWQALASYFSNDLTEAADEIERLRAEVKRLDHAATAISECYNEAEAEVSNLRAEIARKDADMWALITEECAKVADDWLKHFSGLEITVVSAQKWATDSVLDIRDAIRALAPAQEKTND